MVKSSTKLLHNHITLDHMSFENWAQSYFVKIIQFEAPNSKKDKFSAIVVMLW